MTLLLVLLSTTYAASQIAVSLESATQSSNNNQLTNLAAKAIDGSLNTEAMTADGADGWLRVYFTTDVEVGKVVIEKGTQNDKTCVYQVLLYQGDAKLSCGDTFSPQEGLYYMGYKNTTIDCSGARGGSVVLEQTVCEKYITVWEIKVYLSESVPTGNYQQSMQMFSDVELLKYRNIEHVIRRFLFTRFLISFKTQGLAI